MFKVVVVEDEELLRMGLTNFFDWREYGFELAGEAGNGEKGLEMIRQIQPDLVITDIKMPHMDGLEMTEILKREMPELQVLIMSGYDEFEYAKRALKAGVSEYILKPIKMDDLKEAVKKIGADLQKTQSEREELNQLKISQQQHKRARRATIFTDLLVKGKDPETVMADLTEEEMKGYFLAGIISLRDFSVLYMDCDYALVMEKDRELETAIEAGVEDIYTQKEREDLEVIRTTNGERLICFCAGTRSVTEDYQRRLERWIEEQKLIMEQIDVSFGQIVSGMGSLNASYRTARKRSEEKFLRSWQEAGAQSESGKVSFMNYDLSGLCFEIKSGSSHGIEKEMQTLRESLSSDNIQSYLQLVLIVSNIYYELIRIPEEAGGRAEDVVQDPKTYYQKLIGKMKRDEMLSELEDFCLKLHEYYQKIVGDRKQEVMHRVNTYVRKNFSKEDLSMKDVADHVYISVSYLGMIMKKETGKTFTEYLTDIRIEKAKQMLAESAMKNYEIAEACGYTTPAYFSTVFKGTVGMTPSEYRTGLKKLRNDRQR